MAAWQQEPAISDLTRVSSHAHAQARCDAIQARAAGEGPRLCVAPGSCAARLCHAGVGVGGRPGALPVRVWLPLPGTIRLQRLAVGRPGALPARVWLPWPGTIRLQRLAVGSGVVQRASESCRGGALLPSYIIVL